MIKKPSQFDELPVYAIHSPFRCSKISCPYRLGIRNLGGNREKKAIGVRCLIVESGRGSEWLSRSRTMRKGTSLFGLEIELGGQKRAGKCKQTHSDRTRDSEERVNRYIFTYLKKKRVHLIVFG